MRLTPNADEPYGLCEDCDRALGTQDAARDHMSETHEAARAQGGSKGHRIRVTNPTHDERVRMRVESIIRDAVEEAIDELADLREGGDATDEQIRRALRTHSEFLDAWEAP